MFTFRLAIISFHNAAVKDPPQSEDTADGTPNRFSHPCKNAEAAAAEDASLSGRQRRYLEVLSMAVRMYLWP